MKSLRARLEQTVDNLIMKQFSPRVKALRPRVDQMIDKYRQHFASEVSKQEEGEEEDLPSQQDSDREKNILDSDEFDESQVRQREEEEEDEIYVTDDAEALNPHFGRDEI